MTLWTFLSTASFSSLKSKELKKSWLDEKQNLCRISTEFLRETILLNRHQAKVCSVT